MAVSVPKRISIRKYQSEKCDRITLDVPKGKREAYKLVAAELDMSLAQLVQNSVEGYAANHAGAVPTPTPAEILTADEKQLLAAYAKCPENMRSTLKKLVEQVAALVDEKGGDSNGNN